MAVPVQTSEEFATTMQLLGKLLGDPNKRDLKAIQPLIDKINALEPDIKELSDEELAAKTTEFRSQLSLYLKGGLVLQSELLKLFREALDAVEPFSAQCTDEQLHAAISEFRQKLEHHDPEQSLRHHLPDTLSECFEKAYEKLSPALDQYRVTAVMALATERQQWPDQTEDPNKTLFTLLKEIEPVLGNGEIADQSLNEAFDLAWPRFQERQRAADSADNGTYERLFSEIVQHLRPEIIAVKADAMDKLTTEMARRYKQGKTLDDLLPEAFAVVREAGWRKIKMRHYDVQLIGGVVLHQGKIAEMRTGEGKTLVATCPVYLNALTGKGVHVVTVNDYLARRDAEWMGQIYRFLGLSVGVIVHELDDMQRQEAYRCMSSSSWTMTP